MKNIKSKRDGRVISKKWNKGITNNHIKSSTETYDNDSNNDKGRKNMSWCYRRQYYKASIKDMTDRRRNNISYTMKIKSYLSRISIQYQKDFKTQEITVPTTIYRKGQSHALSKINIYMITVTHTYYLHKKDERKFYIYFLSLFPEKEIISHHQKNRFSNLVTENIL